MIKRVLPEDHHCAWREEAEELRASLDTVQADVERMRGELEALKRAVFGKKSEKMPPMSREVGRKPSREETQQKRADNARAKGSLVTEDVVHVVADDKRACPACTAEAKPAGTKESVEIEWVNGFFRRRRHQRETLACSCGEYIVTADAPERVFDKTHYGPGFVAHLVVQTCADSIPIYRLEKQFTRMGIPTSRSTMNDLFHRAGRAVAPLVDRIAVLVRESDLVLADETSHRMQSSTKRPFLWTFVAGNLVLYRFAVNRSGKTPETVLGNWVHIPDGHDYAASFTALA